MDRATTAACLALVCWIAGCPSSDTRPLSIGSKNFTEQLIVSEVIAQHVEHRLQRPVTRRGNLAGTLLAHQALTSRQIDLYPEYTGTALTTILKTTQDLSPESVFEYIRAAYHRDHQIEWLSPLGVNNSFAMVIRGTDARARGLTTLSDAAREAEPWRLGVGYEFERRADGLLALDHTYHIRWGAKPATMDLGLLYTSLEQGHVDMIAANSTDAFLSTAEVVVLDDNRRAFPRYDLCIAVREDTLREIEGLREALGELSGRFTDQRMRELNYQVDVAHRSVAEVATQFLRETGLL